MPALDPATTAALIASLQARTDDGAFSMTSATTTRRFVGTGRSRTTPGALAQQQIGLAPKYGEQAYLVSYVANYRTRRLTGELVVAAAFIDLAKALLALDAQTAFDAIDRRVLPPNNLSPKRSGA